MKEKFHVKTFTELIVYKKSRHLSFNLFEKSKNFPQEELYSLTQQVRRSSRSIGAQIAEAWAKRPYQKHFVSKLTDADAELQETKHWVLTSYDCGYLEKETKDKIINECSEIGRILGGMINKAPKFCNKED